MVDPLKAKEDPNKSVAQPEIVAEKTPATKERPRLGELLVEQGVITRADLTKALGKQFGVPYVNLATYQPQPEALKLIPEVTARKYSVIPLAIAASSLQVAMEDVNNVPVLEALSALAKMRIEPAIAVAEDIQKSIDRNYRAFDEIEKQFVGAVKPTAPIKALDESIAEAPAVRALDLIMDEAIKNRSSDIHIEPDPDKIHIRFRIDGVLKEIISLPNTALAPLISRIKILANMNIADHRPQDGHFNHTLRDKEIDVRVATIASAYGEMATLRILDKSFAIMDLDEIGFLKESLARYQKMLRSPFGMILVSGPTGSGKTTTLYASINSLDRKRLNIITVEDPIEYHLNGINQIQVNPRAGLTFASGLRSILRHDPNIILVGEIRDTDTATIAIQAALTGHLLLASIHANNAVGVLYRLEDLGIEPFLVSTALVGVVAQRMVRRICPHCKETTAAPIEGAVAYRQELGEERKEFVYGKGCSLCAGTGYLGRVAIFEILTLSDELRRLLITSASSAEIKRQAEKEGMTSLRHDAMLKVKAGITTPDEVLRNVLSIG
ncbi:MAG: GspE/PulE family protein [Chloroflexota bacterium]